MDYQNRRRVPTPPRKDSHMEQRTLGQQGLTTSAIGYGSMGITMAYGPSDEQESIAAIRQAYDLGVTMFDTAELYGWGEGEKILGRAIKDFRDDIVIASKFGFTPEFGLDSRPEHIREVINNSLRHLDVDHLDLYYPPRVDPKVPIEEAAGTAQECIDRSEARRWGKKWGQ